MDGRKEKLYRAGWMDPSSFGVVSIPFDGTMDIENSTRSALLLLCAWFFFSKIPDMGWLNGLVGWMDCYRLNLASCIWS